ncbi:hypothetical protein Hte_001529 [Hypoxylon texense]
MASVSQHQLVPWIELPTELIEMIFFHFDDLDTLRAAAHSCSTFYSVFARLDKLLTTPILLRQIHPTVIPDAFAMHASFALPNQKRSTVKLFSKNYLSVEKALPTEWKLSEALPMSRFHKIVSYFATQLASTALNRARDDLRESPRQATPTDTEVCRVQRALYRLQLHCNMFDRLYYISGPMQRKYFFRHFSTWENEQLACVRDLLIGVVAEPYNDLVDHDVRWGCLPRPLSYITFWDLDSAEGEYILAKGLEFLFRLVKTDDYAERRKLLVADDEPAHQPNDRPGRRGDYLRDGLCYLACPPFVDFSRTLGKEQKAAFIGKPFYDDPDPGPAAAWESLAIGLSSRLVGRPGAASCRLWGYVFWDMSRLASLGTLGPYMKADEKVWREREEVKRPERWKLLDKSRKERQKVDQKGGSGWWSFEDQSKVVWERPCP